MSSDVTVIGLGEMGSALAAALVRSGRAVTVWNRTPDKATALAGLGATVAPTAAAAVAASPVVLVCVTDYAVTRKILSDVELDGRVLVQLSTGTPADARQLDEFAREHGADYLDGAIMAWPRQIGTPSAYLAAAGPETAFQQAEDLLRALGSPSYAGPRVTAAATQFAGLLAYLAGHWIGFAHGARVFEAEGFDVAGLGQLVAALAPVLGEDSAHMGRVVAEDRFADPESTLRTAGHDIRGLVRHAEEASIDDSFPAFAAGLFERAVAAGYGDEEHVALVKSLR